MQDWETRQELPNNIEAERAVLGAVLTANDAIYDLSAVLGKADFYEPFHGELWGYMRDQIESGRILSPMTAVHDFAQDRQITPGLKLSDYLRLLVEEAVPALVALDVAKTIRDLALKRRILAVCQDCMEAVTSAPGSESAEGLRMRLDAAMETLFGGVEDLGVRHIGAIAKDVIRRASAAYQAEAVVGLPVGLKSIQDLVGPLMPGRLYLLCGSPGSGKSALAQQMAEFIAQNNPVLFDEIEMPGEEMAERILGARADVAAEKIERAAMDEYDLERLIAAGEKVKGLQLWIDSASAPSAAQIRARAVRMKKLRGLAALFIDHLLYITPPAENRFRSEHEVVRFNLQALKRLAKDLSVPVVCLTQPTKDYTSGPVRRPKVSDMYGGAANEQEADVILLLWRKEYMLRRSEPEESSKEHGQWKIDLGLCEGQAEAILGKRRGARGFGMRTLYFEAEKMRFSDNKPRPQAWVDDESLLWPAIGAAGS